MYYSEPPQCYHSTFLMSCKEGEQKKTDYFKFILAPNNGISYELGNDNVASSTHSDNFGSLLYRAVSDFLRIFSGNSSTQDFTKLFLQFEILIKPWRAVVKTPAFQRSAVQRYSLLRTPSYQRSLEFSFSFLSSLFLRDYRNFADISHAKIYMSSCHRWV